MLRRPALALALALLFVARVGHAQDTITLPNDWVKAAVAPQLHPSIVAYAEDQARSARRTRNAGVGLTVLGTVFTLIGAGLIGGGICFDNCRDRVRADQMMTSGSTLLGLAQLGVIVGIPLWASGQTRADRADRAALTFSSGGARLVF